MWMKFGQFWDTTTYIFVELSGTIIISRVVQTSENVVYKSAINFLIKIIKPHILLFLKRGRPSVRNYS